MINHTNIAAIEFYFLHAMKMIKLFPSQQCNKPELELSMMSTQELY